MNRRSRYCTAAMLLAAFTLATGPTTAVAETPTVEPEALHILKRMTEYLGGLTRFSVDTDNMLEDVLVTGQKIQYDFTATVKIQRPDKLRAERTGDLFRQILSTTAGA